MTHKLHPGQEEVFRDASPRRLVLAGRRWGKDVLVDAVMAAGPRHSLLLDGVRSRSWVIRSAPELLVINEPDLIRSEDWWAIIPLIHSTPRVLMIGTPSPRPDRDSILTRAYLYPRDGWTRFRFPSWTSPFIPHEEIRYLQQELDFAQFAREIGADPLP